MYSAGMDRLTAILRIISAQLILIPGAMASVAVHIEHDETTFPDPATYTDTFGPSSTIFVSGGTATFTGNVQNNVVATVTGGVATFTGEIWNGATFNLTSGITTIDTLKNNADLNVSGDAVLNLVHTVGNNATVSLGEEGTLSLGADNIFAHNSLLNAAGGSLLTNGYTVNFATVIITGSTVIDLGGSVGNVDLGDISGTGELVFTNWSPGTIVNFDPASIINPQTQLTFAGAQTQVIEGAAGPIPEPAVTTLAIALVALFSVRFLRQK